jgi:hypothetical protein
LQKLLTCAAILLFATLPAPTFACSLVGCLNRGVELRRSFTTTVTHQGKPLPRVSVQVTGNSENGDHREFSQSTGSDGRAHFSNLPPGDYWIKADLLGIGAGYECFHINASASKHAKKNRTYDWGDDAVSVAQAVGRLVDSQPGQGPSPLQNLLHRVEVPIQNAKLELRKPISDTRYATVSDAKGHLAFGHVPSGIYVLHIEPGPSAGKQPLDVTDLLVEFSESAKRSSLLLMQKDAGGGSCGGMSLEVEDPREQ